MDSQPCSHCTSVLKKVGVRKVVYSDPDGDFIETSTEELVSKGPTRGFKLLDKKL